MLTPSKTIENAPLREAGDLWKLGAVSRRVTTCEGMSPLRVIYSQGTGAVGTTTVTWPKNWDTLGLLANSNFQPGQDPADDFASWKPPFLGLIFHQKLIVARLTSSNQSSSYAWKYPAWLCLKISGNSVSSMFQWFKAASSPTI